MPAELSYTEPNDLPALFRAADRSAESAQQAFLTATKVRLGSLLLAAIAGAAAVRFDEIQVSAGVALGSFTAALAAELYLATTRPERSWYEGRAAAESAKTIAWRYMVQGEPYGPSDDDAELHLLADLSGLLQDLHDIDIAVGPSDSSEVTEAMRVARDLDFHRRREFYLAHRVEAQRGWYARKSSWNRERARRWTVVGVVAEAGGVIAAALMVLGAIEADVLGMLAALGATATAWVQAKQYRALSTAYGVTALELAAVATAGERIDEAAWARFVDEAEEAISREHTLWRASRGVRRRPRPA